MNESEFWSTWKSLDRRQQVLISSALARGEGLSDPFQADIAIHLAAQRQRSNRILLAAPAISLLLNLVVGLLLGAGWRAVGPSIAIAALLGFFMIRAWRKWNVVLHQSERLNRAVIHEARREGPATNVD